MPPGQTSGRLKRLNRRTKQPRALIQQWQRTIAELVLTDGMWCYSRRPLPDDPAQGWKLHLSATLLSARAVYLRAQPVLRKHNALFKVTRRLEFLAELNSGLPNYSQVGKFLTAYPQSQDEALTLASELHAATHGLRGPQIPFDLRYRAGSIVYYRYGSFRTNGRSKRRGGVIRDVNGKLHPDRRAPGAAVPAWLEDPFRPRQRQARRSRGPIGRDYLPFKAHAQRGKGGVYEAVDLSVSPARLVMIKEGRRDGETDVSGRDGYVRVRDEARVLRRLRAFGVATPEVLAEFAQSGRRYLVLEKLKARPLIAAPQVHPKKHSWRMARNVLNGLEPVLARIHAHGWVWRDCKPGHVFRQGKRWQVIDFEGACRIDDELALPWSSPDYLPPKFKDGLKRRAGTAEDNYALGVIAFQFLAGRFPPASAAERKRVFARTKSPPELRARLERLLRV